MVGAPTPRIVLTRSVQDNLPLATALAAKGIPVQEIPCLEVRYLTVPDLPPAPSCVAFSSRHSVLALENRGLLNKLLKNGNPLLAAVGPSTARQLLRGGHEATIVADPPTGKVLATMLSRRISPETDILLICGNLQGGGLEPWLRRLGFHPRILVVYENISPQVPFRERFPVAAVLVASPSAGRRLCRALPWMLQNRFLVPGPTTARAMRKLGARFVEEVGVGQQVWLEALKAAWMDTATPSHPPLAMSPDFDKRLLDPS